jgi:uncharacterized YccA/Bax inhibitor family protein
MRTSNPALREDVFTSERYGSATGAMTVRGTANKTLLLLALVTASASFTWSRAESGFGLTIAMGAGIVGFILALILCFKKTWAPVLAPAYAIVQGLFLGGISAFYQARYGGIVFQAVALTFGTLFAMLGAYQTGLIRATEKFKLGIVAATGGIFLVYLVSFVLGFFGIQIPGIFGNGAIGIGFSVVVVIIAALNLVLDFDFIEQGAAVGAPKYLEWYAAFGLLVTLVWLYLEILRLLSKLRSR